MVVRKFIVASVITGLVFLTLSAIPASQAALSKNISLQQTEESSCATTVKSAVDSTNAQCASTGRNQVCYGNAPAIAQARVGQKDFKFERPGDIVKVSAIQSLQLGSVADSQMGGIALLRIQANLPDTAPGQNVTVLLFGDVAIADASRAPVAMPTELPVTMASISSTLNATVVSTVTPRPKATSKTGAVGGYTSMQAFYFRSGIGQSSCAEVPESGILIQAPASTQPEVKLWINGATFEFGSTAFLQAIPGQAMIINVIDGAVTVTAQGQSKIVTAGTKLQIPLDANLVVSGPPGNLVGLNPQVVAPLPVQNLPTSVTIPNPKQACAAGQPSMGLSDGQFTYFGCYCAGTSHTQPPMSAVLDCRVNPSAHPTSHNCAYLVVCD